MKFSSVSENTHIRGIVNSFYSLHHKGQRKKSRLPNDDDKSFGESTIDKRHLSHNKC